MDYQNTDEATRREACERVKQIVKAIKAIKIKYYLIFSKMSPKDKELYDALENQLEEISERHDLHKLKVALMSAVDARYTPPIASDRNEDKKDPQSNIDLCYGAIDVQKEALSQGRISQAIRSQKKLEELIKLLNEEEVKVVTEYKRKKLAQLNEEREKLEEQIIACNKTMKGMYKPKHVEMRAKTQKILKSCTKVPRPNREKDGMEIV